MAGPIGGTLSGVTDDPVGAATEALYGVPLSRFVEERKRLAAELKAAGKKLPAQRLAAISRPAASVWAINQLWRQARTEVDALFAAAAKVRDGDLGAMGIHREVLADLRARGAELLRADGSAANEATLRRITQTLQALAAAGGFEPDQPGQLTTDREPPGFEALAGLVGEGGAPEPARPIVKEKKPKAATAAATETATAPATAAAPAAAAAAAAAAAPAAAAAAAPAPATAAAAAAAAAPAPAPAPAAAPATAEERAAARRALEHDLAVAERAAEAAARKLDAARVALVQATERHAALEIAEREAGSRLETAAAALAAFGED